MVIAIVLFLIIIILYVSVKVGYWQGTDCIIEKRLDGKTIIITGANSGIGYEIALDFARRGANIIIACRNLTKADIAVEKVISQNNELNERNTYYRPVDVNNIHIEQLDLSSFESISDFVKRVLAKYENIHGLINNAGIGRGPSGLTSDNLPLTMGTNHIGQFYLTNLLIDRISSSNGDSHPRIIIVTSRLHFLASTNRNNIFESIHGSEYSNSKLANVVHAIELSERYKNIISCSVHPGLVATNIFNYSKFMEFLVNYLIRPFVKSPRNGAQTIIHCMLADDIVSGGYYADCERYRPSSLALDSSFREAIWNQSMDVINQVISKKN